ncbi:MAG TPA: MFS transporter [Chthonomonadaceae bacterium]|nr:MFS transporter [Chthonomonadaceae bacterium]
MNSSPETPTVPDENTPLPWYRGVPRYAWVVLLISAMGWAFDTMDQNLFNQLRPLSVREIMTPAFAHAAPGALDAAVKGMGGNLTAVFLIGWATGGFVFGIVGDRLGRTRTMVITIFIYAIFTGLNGLAHTPFEYGLCRFLTALGVGGEFAAGTALVAESWPARSRPTALAALQASSALGNIVAAFIALSLANAGWRWAYAVGALPALLVLWIRSSVKEPESWVRAKAHAKAMGTMDELGNVADLATDAVLRRNTIAGVLMAAAGVGGVWGVGFFLPDLIQSTMKPLVQHYPEVLAIADPALQKKTVSAILQSLSSKISIIQQIGAFIGMFSYAPLSQRFGRRPALLVFFILAFIAVQAAFFGIRDIRSACLLAFPLGVFALAPFGAYAVYFPELYPTRLRSTGIGFCYNGARLVAAAAPLILGQLASHFAKPGDDSAGLRTAASIVACVYVLGIAGVALAPETRGRPLPE